MSAGDADRPLVSIVIPVYNGSKYLSEAIDSALNQTYEDIEIVVINDGSTDGGETEAIARGYGDRIRYLSKENGGVATALNFGIENARGKYISWLSHDDVYERDKVERQISFLKRMGEKASSTIPYGSFVYIDEKSKILGRYTLPKVPPQRLYQALLCESVFLSPIKRKRFGVNGCTTLIPKEAFDKVGLFNPKLRTTQDYDMWFKLNRFYDFVQVEGSLLRSRQHAEQGYRTMRSHVVVEVNELFSRALGYYESGSEKWDLDLPQVALAMRMVGLKKDAARNALEMARKADKEMKGMVYYSMARLWNPAFKMLFELTDRTKARN